MQPARSPLHPALIDELAGSVVGLVLDGTDACSTYDWDARRAPAVLVEAASPADVAAATRFAAAQHVPLTVQSRSAPRPSAAGTVLLSTARMQGVWLDPVHRTARVEAGVRWAAVLEAAAAHDLAAVTGPAAGDNVVADVLRGRVGPLTRAYGVAADHVRRLEIVTADGSVRSVGSERDAGRSPAVCGGAARGVVTAVELALVEVGRVHCGVFQFEAADASSVAHHYRAWSATLPDRASTSIALLPALVRVDWCFAGAAADGERLLAPLLAGAPLLRSSTASITYADCLAQSVGRPGTATCTVLRELPAQAVDALLAVVGAGSSSPPELVELRQGRASSFQVTVAGPPGARAAVAAALSPWAVEDRRGDR